MPYLGLRTISLGHNVFDRIHFMFPWPTSILFEVQETSLPLPTNPEIERILDSNISLTPGRIWIDDDVYNLVNQDQLLIEHKDKLVEHYLCAYTFPACSGLITADIRSFELSPDNPLGNHVDVISVFDQNKYKYFLHARGYFFGLVVCSNENRCFDAAIIPNIIDTFVNSVELNYLADSFTYYPPTYERVTERILIKEASSRIEVHPAEFKAAYENILISEVNICPAPIALYDTIVEQILIKDAFTQIVAHPAEYETVTEIVLLKEAANTYDTLSLDYSIAEKIIEICPPIRTWSKISIDTLCSSDSLWPCVNYRWDHIVAKDTALEFPYFHVSCPEGFNQLGHYCIRLRENSAEYEERMYQRLVQPATTQTTNVPAEYKTIRRIGITNLADVPDSCILATYDSVTFQKLIQPVSTGVVEIPAEYGERIYEKLVSPASYPSHNSPPDPFLYAKKEILLQSKFNPSFEYVCDKILTSDIIEKIKAKLLNQGFDSGTSQDPLDHKFACAIIEYQQKNKLPIGRINFETLSHLNVDY